MLVVNATLCAAVSAALSVRLLGIAYVAVYPKDAVVKVNQVTQSSVQVNRPVLMYRGKLCVLAASMLIAWTTVGMVGEVLL